MTQDTENTALDTALDAGLNTEDDTQRGSLMHRMEDEQTENSRTENEQAESEQVENSRTEEEQFLEEYRQRKQEYPPFALTADIVLLTVKNGKFSVLLIERGGHPFKSQWALPGGFVHEDESAVEAALRELREETSLSLDRMHIEQLKTYSAPDRDPRMRVISTAFIALVPDEDLHTPQGSDDAVSARFFPVHDLLYPADVEDTIPLAFNHEEILRDGVQRTSSKLEYTDLGITFLSEPFTLADLRRIYEEVWNVTLHAPNFRRKILGTEDFIIPLEEKGGSKFSSGRQAKLYRKGHSSMLMPPFLRDTALRTQ